MKIFSLIVLSSKYLIIVTVYQNLIGPLTFLKLDIQTRLSEVNFRKKEKHRTSDFFPVYKDRIKTVYRNYPNVVLFSSTQLKLLIV